jgi:hypothetical protein
MAAAIPALLDGRQRREAEVRDGHQDQAHEHRSLMPIDAHHAAHEHAGQQRREADPDVVERFRRWWPS